MIVRFTESVRIRLWGTEYGSFRKGEIHSVPLSVAGVLLAQGCAEPVPAAGTAPTQQPRIAS